MKLSFTLILTLFFHCCFSSTFYISPNGNDNTGNGSIGNPWKTLYKATSAVITAGDIIHVNSGIYTETQQCVLAIAVSIEGDGITSILKSTLTADWTEMLSLRSSEGTNGNQHISNLKFDGQSLATFWGIYVAGRSNVSIYDITMVDFKDRGILFCGRNDNLEAAPAIYATGNKFYNNTITNCAAYNTENGVYGRGCLCIGGQSGMLIYNNIITQNSRELGYNGWPIKYYNGGYLNNCKIYNNKLTKIPMNGPAGDQGWDFAIELFNESGLEIYGNTIQGAIDLNFQKKGSYDYSVWIHDNIISQPTLNRYVETGITLEFSTEAAIIENNHFKNIGIQVFFTPREGDLINNVTIKNNTCEDIGVADKSHLGYAISVGSDENGLYSITNFFVLNNSFIGNVEAKPYWGIGILGVLKANNIQIINNSINNFSAGYLVVNPASVIDTMIVKGNILSGNGFANKPAFNIGNPKNYFAKNNSSTHPSVFSLINIKMNVIRPVYYTIKSFSVLELIAIIAGIISLWFSRKENIYVFPMGLIAMVIYSFFDLEQDFLGQAGINFCFIIMGIYGWVQWSKRDRRNHRIIRITSSAKKEWFLHLAVFGVIFFIIFFCLISFANQFASDIIPIADAFAIAAAFTGMWLMTKKKIESWYWLIMTFLVSVPLYFIKHFVFVSMYNCVLLAMAAAGLYRWKNRRVLKNINPSVNSSK